MRAQATQSYIGRKHKMGRYISTGSTQIGTNCCIAYTTTTCQQYPGFQYSYDLNQCFQNRVMVTKPGSYSFVLPLTSTGCIRAIAVGGGGKACCSDFYCNFAGSGGGYAESVHCVAPGCTFTIVVGRQQASTTISYTCLGGTAQTVTGGGATGRTPGVGSGGNLMNSTGGCGGWGRNYQEVNGTCPSTCICFCNTTCCGYCIIYGCNCQQSTSQDYCAHYFPGGGSAGSFMFPCGGCGGTVCNKGGTTTNNNNGGSMAGGGGGIGYINRCCSITAFCGCICSMYGNSQQPCVCGPTTVQGGGGTRYAYLNSACEQTMWNGLCEGGVWRMGAGGWGGCDNQEGRPDTMYWTCALCMCTGRSEFDVCCGIAPKKWPWFDIMEMAGSGSSGKGIGYCRQQINQDNYWTSTNGKQMGGIPEDSGEGAGTGGAIYPGLCDAYYVNWPCLPSSVQTGGIDWNQVCCFGVNNTYNDIYDCCQSSRNLVVGHISQAGTLGGSGGIGVHGFASKAGFGGGAGAYKYFVHCICWGTGYDCCGGSGPLLAFPPCILDNIASNAGSGLAIIYWKD